jgi:hypothetical protein
VFCLSIFRQEAERLRNPLLNLNRRTIFPLVSNAERREAETGGGDACHSAWAAPVRFGTIHHQPGNRVSFIPEKFKSGALKFVEQNQVAHRQLGRAGENVGSQASPCKRKDSRPRQCHAKELTTGRTH